MTANAAFRDLSALAMGAEMYPEEFIAGVQQRECSNMELFLLYAIGFAHSGGRGLACRTEGNIVWAPVGRNATHNFYLGIDPEADTLFAYSEGEDGYDAEGYVTWTKSKPYAIEHQKVGYVGHW
jgi:hypothetical protein